MVLEMVQQDEGRAQQTQISILPLRIDDEFTRGLLGQVRQQTGSEGNFEPKSRYLVQDPRGEKLFEEVILQAMQKALAESGFPFIREVRLETGPNGESTKRTCTSTPCAIYHRYTNIMNMAEKGLSSISGLEVIFLKHKDADDGVYDIAKGMIVTAINNVLVESGNQPIYWT